MSPKFLNIILLLFLITSCNEGEELSAENPILASVYDNKLYYTDIEPMIQQETSGEDSILYTNAIIEKWVRDAILMYEAEKNIPPDLDIEKMVDDYRSSLILMNYTQKLVHETLDTTITQAQLDKYYEENKSQFKLEEPILKCLFIKINEEIDSFEIIEALWKGAEYEEIASLNEEIFEFKLSGLENWNSWKDIKSLMPNGFWSYNDLKNDGIRSKTSGESKYFIKVFEMVDENKTPPLSYIEDQAKKVILHKRQSELLDNLREDLYEKYSKNNNVKINL